MTKETHLSFHVHKIFYVAIIVDFFVSLWEIYPYFNNKKIQISDVEMMNAIFG